MPGLWRNQESTPEGKYLVKRRNGTIPNWRWFVLGEADRAAPAGLRAYADKCEELGYDPQYVAEVRAEADAWERTTLTPGDPTAPPDLQDDPQTVEEMRKGHSA